MSLLITIFFVLWAIVTIRVLIGEGVAAAFIGDILICAVAAILFMSVVFAIARRMKRYDLVDAAWGAVFIVLALTSFLLNGTGGIDLLVTVLVVIWGSRLSLHILNRIKHTDKEDPRYVELRQKWKGNLAVNVYFRIYIVQALLALFISMPVILTNLFNASTRQWKDFFSISIPTAIDLLLITVLCGLLIWVVGFAIEVIADKQLRNFVSQSKNKGQLMTSGLWKYSRHPNYFGELTQWWGIFIISLTTSFGFIGIIGPVLITYLILFISGIPPNERRFEGRPGWDEYRRRTSVLIPLPPRS